MADVQRQISDYIRRLDQRGGKARKFPKYNYVDYSGTSSSRMLVFQIFFTVAMFVYIYYYVYRITSDLITLSKITSPEQKQVERIKIKQRTTDTMQLLSIIIGGILALITLLDFYSFGRFDNINLFLILMLFVTYFIFNLFYNNAIDDI